MYVARLVIVLLLILVVVVAYNPQAREQAVKIWERIRPAVVEITDRLYVAVRNFVTGSGPRDRLDETPVPGPGGNFQRIVTLHSSFVL